MDPIVNSLLMLALIIILIYLSGWFSGTETAITNIDNSQLANIRRSGDRRGWYVIELRKNMDRTLITILVGNNIVNIVLSSVAALFANSLFHALGVSIMIGIITFLIIVFGEITPKSKAIIESKKISLRRARILYYLGQILTPFISLFQMISRNVIRLSGNKPRKGNMLLTDQSIKDLASLGEEEGVIKRIERDIIHKTFAFGDRKIKEIMVPMHDVFHIDRDLTTRQAIKVISKSGFTRIPFIGPRGKVEGLIYSKDLLGKGSGKLSNYVRPAIFVGHNTDITDAFKVMKNKRIHMAIVIGPKGDHIGVVTLEDILEELVGEIYDEYFKDKVLSGKGDMD